MLSEISSSRIAGGGEQPAGPHLGDHPRRLLQPVRRGGRADLERRLGQRRGEEEVVGLVELRERVDVGVDVLQRPQQRQHPGGAAELGGAPGCRPRSGCPASRAAASRRRPGRRAGRTRWSGSRAPAPRRRAAARPPRPGGRARRAASRRASTAATASGSGLRVDRRRGRVADPQRARAAGRSARRTGVVRRRGLVARAAGPAPMIASSSAALSRTVRDTTPWVTIPNITSPVCGP